MTTLGTDEKALLTKINVELRAEVIPPFSFSSLSPSLSLPLVLSPVCAC
jgi:hypothetical protein